jgi:hypothetical protein
MIRGCAIPVYALGGMSLGDLERAWQCGGHGIAIAARSLEALTAGAGYAYSWLPSGVPLSGGLSTGIRKRSAAQSPRSIVLQRSEQNGR